MKVDELRALSGEDLSERLSEFREEFFNLRFQSATGQLDNYARMGQVKREIARISTILKERELGIEIVVHEETETNRRKRKVDESESAEKRRIGRRRKAEDKGAEDAAASEEDEESADSSEGEEGPDELETEEESNE